MFIRTIRKKSLENDYKIRYKFYLENKNINLNSINDLIRTLVKVSDIDKIEKVTQYMSDSKLELFDSLSELVLDKLIKHLLLNNESSLRIQNNSSDSHIDLLNFNDTTFYLSISVNCKNKLNQFYNFLENLEVLKINNINPIKLLFIDSELLEYVDKFFTKLYFKEVKKEYKDVVNGDFIICSGINWNCLLSLKDKDFGKKMKYKTFGNLPLFPFPDYSILEELPIFKITSFENGTKWIQICEDVCPWDNDEDYINSFHKFVDSYIEKRDAYFYSLPLEIQKEWLSKLIPNQV